MTQAFVYCWTDHKKNMLYVGYHKGSKTDGYVCSSKKMIGEYKKRPEDFTRQIIASGDATEMYNFEQLLLRSLDVRNDPSFYNLTNGTPPVDVPWNKGIKTGPNPDHSARMKGNTPWNKGLPKEHQPGYGKVGYWKGKKAHNHGVRLSEEERKKCGIHNIGRKQSSESILKRSRKLINVPQQRVKCPYCGKEGGISPMKRWHFDNCRR